jgi:tRNA threonylcarbamoyladenosine biosynthesis protein TsaE
MASPETTQGKSMETFTHKNSETRELAKKLARGLKGGEVLALYGDLGVGKTTFVQGLAEGLGIEKPVLSPTFVLRRSYEGWLTLNHYDFYRLEEAKDLENLDIEDDINPESVTVIEWPDKVGFERAGMVRIKFSYVDEDTRKIIYE